MQPCGHSLSHGIRSSRARSKHTWRDPSGNIVNDIHDHTEAKQLGVKHRGCPCFQAEPPQTGMVGHHT